MTVALSARPASFASEKDFQSAVVGLARVCGWMVMHSRPAMDRRGRWSTPISGDKGYPDITAVHPDGMLIFAELKVGKNRATPQQAVWLDLLGQIPGDFVEAYCWTPADWDEIQQVLEVRAT